MSKSEEKTKLIHRINRIQGQLEAIKKSVEQDSKDCEKTLLLLKASSQALKKFGEAYVNEHMESCFADKKQAGTLDLEIKKAIKAAFSL